MEITATTVWEDLLGIRSQAPLVHNITNYVVMNTTANALLALGASPAMVHAQEEVTEFVRIASALVVNIGTLSPAWVKAMELAMHQAREGQKPVVFDPVGAGATAYRTHTARHLLQTVPPSVIRGNASEIKALVENTRTKGVDSLYASNDALESALQLAGQYGSVVVVSGASDYLTDGKTVLRVSGGHPMMTKVTGMGCTATALIGAFLAVRPLALAAAAHAMVIMSIAGELAAQKAAGPGSLQMHFYDVLYGLTEGQVHERTRIETLTGSKA